LRNLDEEVIALTLGVLVSDEGQVGIELFAEGTDNTRVVELVVLQKHEGLAVKLDVNLADCVVSSRLCVALSDASLEERVEEAKAIAALDLVCVCVCVCVCVLWWGRGKSG
jgi:hypothetical protein